MPEQTNSPPTSPKPRRDPYRLIGEIFGGHYRLDEFAGAGSFGAVYQATHTELDRIVAIKILKPDLGEHEEMARELFRREAKTAGSLRHPRIVAVTDVGEESGIAYLVMEWLEGRSLDKEMQMHGPFSPEKTAALLEQIADGLHYAHERGVIHRDIKPANIHLGEVDVIKVLDFGIAKILDSSSAATASRIAGTTAYMSPEQIMGAQIDRRADIYALGVMLFQMLAGQLPFDGTKEALRQKHLDTIPRSLSDVCPALPEQLSVVIQRALAKKPEERQSNVLELRDQFIGALRPVLIPGVPTEVPNPKSRIVEKESPSPSHSGWAETLVEEKPKAQGNDTLAKTLPAPNLRQSGSGFFSRIKSLNLFRLKLPFSNAPASAAPQGTLQRWALADLAESITEEREPFFKWTPRNIFIKLLGTLLYSGSFLTAFYVLNSMWEWCTPTLWMSIKKSSVAIVFSAGLGFFGPNFKVFIIDELRKIKRYSISNPSTFLRKEMLKLCGFSSFFSFSSMFTVVLWGPDLCSSSLPPLGLFFSLLGTGALIGFIFCGVGILLAMRQLRKASNIIRLSSQRRQ